MRTRNLGQGTGKGSKLGTGNLGQGRELTGNWGQQTGDRELGAGNWGLGQGTGNLGQGTGGRKLGQGTRGREANWGQGTWDREGTGGRELELETGNWGQGTGLISNYCM